MHRADRLPRRRLRATLAGGSLLHDGRGGRQRHGGAERALLDTRTARSTHAPVRVPRDEVRGRRRGPERRRRRLCGGDGVRQAVRLRGLPRRRRRIGARAPGPDRGGGDLQDGRLLPGRGRRGDLRLRRGPLPRLHGGRALDAPVVGMAASPSGRGYWLVAADGGIFDYGDALFYGSMGGRHLNAPVVGIAATPSGRGYWLVASDGGIFTYGDAVFLGSMGGKNLNAPIVGIAATPTGQGYWLVAADGGIFAYGDAVFDGSTGAIHLNRPVVGIAPTATTPATGWWPRTGGSSPSAVRPSSGHRHDGKGEPMNALLTVAAAVVAVVPRPARPGRPAASRCWPPSRRWPSAPGATATAPPRPGSWWAGPWAGRRWASSWRRWPSASAPPRPPRDPRRRRLRRRPGGRGLRRPPRGLPPPLPQSPGQRALARPVPAVGLGAGFGWQIGAGLATYIKTAALYLMRSWPR